MWSDFVPVGGGKAVFDYSATVGEESAAKRIPRLAAGTLEKEKSILFSREQLPFRSVQNKDFRFDIPLYVRWAVAPGGRIYLGTADRYEIKAMTLDGQALFAFSRDYDRIPVPLPIQTAALKQVSDKAEPLRAAAFRPWTRPVVPEDIPSLQTSSPPPVTGGVPPCEPPDLNTDESTSSCATPSGAAPCRLETSARTL